MPMPMSVLRKQAQPGGRKRSARAVNDGLDGRSERQASGRGHSRAAGFTKRPDILSTFPWRASARWCSLATAYRRVAVRVWGWVASPNVLRVQSLPLLASLLRCV